MPVPQRVGLTGSQALPGEPISRGSASSLPKKEAEPPDMRYQAKRLVTSKNTI